MAFSKGVHKSHSFSKFYSLDFQVHQEIDLSIAQKLTKVDLLGMATVLFPEENFTCLFVSLKYSLYYWRKRGKRYLLETLMKLNDSLA